MSNNKLFSLFFFFFSSRRRHTRSVSAFLLNRSSDLCEHFLPKKLFRIRMSRNFGMKMLTMTNLSTECLIQLTKLGYDATPFRSEERRVGKEGRYRWWPGHLKKRKDATAGAID